MSELLEQSRCAAFRDTGTPVDDQILDESSLVEGPSLDGQSDPRVATNVADLLALCQVRREEFVAVEADPHDRNLRTAVGVQGDEVRERWTFEKPPAQDPE